MKRETIIDILSNWHGYTMIEVDEAIKGALKLIKPRPMNKAVCGVIIDPLEESK